MTTRHKWKLIAPYAWECINCDRTRSKRGTLGYLYKGGTNGSAFEAGSCPNQKTKGGEK